MSILGSIAEVSIGSSAGLWIIGGGAALAIAAVGTQTWRLHDAQTALARGEAQWAKDRAELADRARIAEERQRAIEDQRVRDLEGIANAAHIRIAAAEAAASAADAARERMQLAAGQAAAAARRRAGANPAASGGGAPAGDPIGVLADVLGRADEAAGLMAALADRRGVRGEACERAYEALRQSQP